MPVHTIVLAHGLFGFGNPDFLGLILPIHLPVQYFNGIEALFSQKGIVVAQPQVASVGTVLTRAETLASVIKSLPAGRVDIIAHSMGGLDARHALSNIPGVAGRVTSLTTIGTPHLGSPVADAVSRHGENIRENIPPSVFAQIGAISDLTEGAAETFNAKTVDKKEVKYFNIAGDASKSSSNEFLFQLAESFWKFSNKVSDGVVLRDSALYPGHIHLDDWPVDHLGEIGWSSPKKLFPSPGDFYPVGHLERYEQLLETILRV